MQAFRLSRQVFFCVDQNLEKKILSFVSVIVCLSGYPSARAIPRAERID